MSESAAQSAELPLEKEKMANVDLAPYHEAPFGQRLMSRGNMRLMLSAGATLTLGIMGRYGLLQVGAHLSLFLSVQTPLKEAVSSDNVGLVKVTLRCIGESFL
jgi:hypothetical protein